jgi:lysophospholipase L1-like esterase
MVPHDAPSPSPSADGTGGGSAPPRRRLVPVAASGGLLVGGLLGSRAARGVRALRAAGATVPALDHTLDLPGTAPARRVVVLGDSAAAGHGLPSADAGLARRVGRALHAADGRATAVRSVARDGAVTADVLAEQLPAAAGADVVVIGVGVNDAIKRPRLGPVMSDLRSVLRGVRAAAAARAAVVLLTCPDLSAAPGVPWLLRPVLGWRCRALARRQAGVAAELGVPVVAVDRTALTPSVFGTDGFHPGALGHDRLAVAVLARLAAGDRT